MRTRSIAAWLGAAVALCIAAGVVGWAGHAVFAPPTPVATADFVTATVTDDTVEDSLSVSATAGWSQRAVASNAASGVVTSVDLSPGAWLAAGDVLYTVDLRPVTAGAGDVPMFRPLGRGSSGADVSQLQSLLASTGHYTGRIDGVVEALTEKAIRAWQRSLGVEADGVVRQPDVVFLPRLPARMSIDEETVATGLTLIGGERAIFAVDDAPSVELEVTPDQSAAIADGAGVDVSAPDGSTWRAVTGERRSDDENGVVRIGLATPEGGTACAESCELIPLGPDTMLSARVVIQPAVTGPTIPTAALLTDADGDVSVVDESGREHPVTVLATAQGMSVVHGIDVGTIVRVAAGTARPGGGG